MKTYIIGASSDLGVSINGTKLGPKKIINGIKKKYDNCIIIKQDDKICKSVDSKDLRKNENEINKYNTKIYNKTLENIKNGYFPILIGGDHSISIASALASQKANENIGIIWFDAHTDFNTFETTETGNIHGLPLAAICGYKNKELRKFFDEKPIDPKNIVVVGARSIDKQELVNVKDAGITVFTTEDIKSKGIKYIVDEAFKIASNNTNKVHVSYDLDLIDPKDAPGVTVPEINGITKSEALELNNEILNHINEIVSCDLVELNPDNDIDLKTENFAIKMINQMINKVNEK